MRSMLVCFAVAATFAFPCSTRADDDDLSNLIGQLTGNDAAARIQAVDALADLGPRAREAIEPLTTALSDSDAEVRWRAARALGTIGDAAAEAAPALAKALGDESPLVRAQSAFSLGLVGDAGESVVEALAGVIADKDAQVRRAAISSLRRLKPDSKVVIPLVAKALHDADPSVVGAALHSLAEAGAAAVPMLMKALEAPEARYWACLVLAEVGPDAKDAVPALVKTLSDEEPGVRMQALIALGEIGPDALPAAEAVTKALSDPEGAVRYGAVFALAKIGAKDAAPALEEALSDSDPFMSMLAAWTLAKLAPDDEAAMRRAVDQIVEALKGDNPGLRVAAAKALFDLKAPEALVAPALIAALDDKDPVVQAHVYEGLASLGETAVPKVIERFKNSATREKALRVLTLMGPAAKAAVPDLVAAIKGADAKSREALFHAFAAIGPASQPAVAALIQGLADEDPAIRQSACYALGKIGKGAKSAVGALRKLLKAEDRLMRLVAIWALLRIQPGDAELIKLAVPKLTDALTDVESELARVEAAGALGDIGARAKSALPALKKALHDDSPHVRDAAAEAIGKIEK